MGDAIFHRDGDLFVPSEYASSPWYRGYVHGGPPAGLLARCIEQVAVNEGIPGFAG